MHNYALKTPPDVADGHTFEKCNFTQKSPHTAIYTGKTGLTFIDCNLTNCDLPAGAILVGGTNSHISFCSNLHPHLAANVCDEICEHVVSADKIVIDGVTVATNYTYDHKAVA